MGILYVHVSSDASESEHQQAREALALALSIDPTSQPSQRVNVSERVSQPKADQGKGNHGAPAKGSQEARDRMAAVRAAKAAKASGQAAPAKASGKAAKSAKASDRIAQLAAKAGLVAVPDPTPEPTPERATVKRFSLPAFASDLTDDQADALEAFCENLVDQRKLTAMVLYLQGKASRDDLSEVSSRGGTLVDHAERVVRRAERA